MSLISVILPVYNGSLFIEESIRSILSQTFKDFKLYVINDGSTDCTLDVISKISDERIHLINNDGNRGLVYSLNKGLELSRASKYIVRMDADDISLEDRFEKQVHYLEINNEVGILGTAFKKFDASINSSKVYYRPELNSEILSTFLFYNPLFHPTMMIRSSILKFDDIYPSNFPKYEDYGFWINLSLSTKFANLNDPLLLYRRHDSNITNTYVTNIEEDLKVNSRLLLLLCKIWKIDLSRSEIEMLGVISSSSRHSLMPNISAKHLVNLLERLIPKLPIEFDQIYFKKIFCDRCVQYFLLQKKFIELIRFLTSYKYDKLFLLNYLFKGKK